MAPPETLHFAYSDFRCVFAAFFFLRTTASVAPYHPSEGPMNHRAISLFAALAAGMSVPATALANASGRTGVSTSGCSCHGASADSSTTATFTPPSLEVMAGDTITINYAVSSTSGSRTGAGMNVSVSSGTLGAGTGTKVSSGEITHSARSSTGAFTFTWTAPATAGTVTFSGVGNAVDNSSTSSGDGWNFASDLEIRVCVDNDSDGSSDCDGDCDDSDPSVYPGNTEVCDGVDNDCDTDIDEGIATFTYYGDGDGDGHGASSSGTTDDCSTSAPSGYASSDDDCDDTDSAIFPGAAEVCDGADNDCDTSIDEGLPTNDFYVDGDGDGFGAGSVALSDCDSAAPSGYSSTADDCDDGEAMTYPGAPEQCDGVDNDCDTAVDNDVIYSDWYPDMDGDGFGDMGADPVNDCMEPSNAVLDNTDCDDASDTTYPGADDTWYDGVDSDCAEDNDFDADGDGYESDTESDGGTDCDDTDDSIHPDATDIEDDGIDQDCDGMDATAGGDDGGGDDGGGDDGTVEDADGDGMTTAEGDCDDTNATIYDGAPDPYGDGVDQDCDGADSVMEPIADVEDVGDTSGKGCATASAPMAAGLLVSLVGMAFVRRRED